MKTLLAHLLPILLILLVVTSHRDGIRATANLSNSTFWQEARKVQEEQKSSAALMEASQLNLAVVRLFKEGKFEEALPLAKRDLELREAALGADHESVQSARLNLADLYLALKKYGEARKIVEGLLKTHQQTVGLEDAATAVFLYKLAVLAYAQRDFGQAETALKRALGIREKVFGPNHEEFAGSLYALAEYYRLTRKYDVAQPLYEQAALLREKLLGREHPDYERTREKYFCLVYETTKGEALTKKLEEFRLKLGGTPSPSTIEAGLLNGRALSLPIPSYPVAAKVQRLQGTVIIKVKIDETGRVIEAADMCNGNPVLVQSSLQSARGGRFSPTMLSGQPVKVSGVISYNFEIR